MGKRFKKKANPSYSTITKENDKFVQYYKAQGIVEETEWEDMMASLRSPLPSSFRFAGNRETAHSLNQSIISHYLPPLHDISFEGEKIIPPIQIPWYPDGLAWQLDVPKKVLRKQPEFKKLHSFLVYETEGGNVSRQETVSMIPPLFLGIEPHHKVLDMCAAPGSKTAQLLEALSSQGSETSASLPPGIVIANDSDTKRAHMLIHQATRLPSASFMVTNQDASNYPGIKVPPRVNGKSGTKPQPMLFDRILCDVPCSGDGTLRKNVAIWNTWQPGDGNGLHTLQVRILQRAMRLLAPHGRIVYSTCSLNPVENEAVIAEALNSYPAFHLVDVSSSLSDLKRRPGMTSWVPAINRDNGIHLGPASYAAFISGPAIPGSSRLSSGHWPPENASSLNLERCLRIYPHLQNTGGFFVAVLERAEDPAGGYAGEMDTEGAALPQPQSDASHDVPTTPPISSTLEFESGSGDVPSEPQSAGVKRGAEEEEPSDSKRRKVSQAESSSEDPVTKTGPGNLAFKEDPYTYLSPDNPVLSACRSRLHLKPDFPFSSVLVRNPDGSAVRSIYLTNDLVKTIFEHNDYSKIRVMAAGTKVFVKQESGKGFDAQFRILGEGLEVVLPFVDPSFIDKGTLATLKLLLSSNYPLFTSFNADFQTVIEGRGHGCMILRIPAEELQELGVNQDIIVPLWKSNVSVCIMIDKKAKSAMSMRLFGDDITPHAKVLAETLPKPGSGQDSEEV